jgi:putative transposase
VEEVRGEWNVSIRRACRVLLFNTSSYHYKSRRPGQAVLEQRIKEICQTRVRYGYRRVHVLLCREDWRISQRKTYRVYREMGLQLRNKTPKRRVKAKLWDDRKIATRPNESWAMDWVHDQLATGRKIRVLTVVDTFSRYSPAIDPRLSYRGEDVVQVLEKACARVGYPTTIRVDQGTEFVSGRSGPVGLHQMRHAGLHTVKGEQISDCIGLRSPMKWPRACVARWLSMTVGALSPRSSRL